MVDGSPDAVLLDAVASVLAAGDLPDTLQRVVDVTLSMSSAERGFVILRGPSGLEFWAARNLERADVDDPGFQVSHGVVEEVLRSGEAVRLADARESRSGQSSLVRIGTRSVLAVPLGASGELSGVLYLDHRKSRGVFTDERFGMVERFAGLIRRVLDQAVSREALKGETERLKRELAGKHALSEAIGTDPKFVDAIRTAAKLADSRVPVLLQGESGTGKELLARILHFHGARSRGAFVPVNCSALPDTLLEDELFGHERGAFSGANESRPGRFEAAHGGTLFLDEIAELPLASQAKLLRAIQYGEVQRLGSDRPVTVDARVVAATHQDLADRVKTGLFREDLLYRLNAVVLRVPPLRERREDIPVLAKHFLANSNRRENKQVQGFSPEALARFQAHAWPGNVRELENAVLRAVVLCEGSLITPDLLPAELVAGAASEVQVAGGPPESTADLKAARQKAVSMVDRAFVEHALRRAHGNVSEAARLTGTHRTHFQAMLRRYGIKPHAFKE